MDKIKYFIGTVFILIAVSGTLFHDTSRPGFFISLAFIGVIGAITLIMNTKWKKKRKRVLYPWPTS